MKKLLSFVLVAVMLFSAMTVFSSAAADKGTLVFEENFDDATKVNGWKNSILGNSGLLSKFTVEGGKLLLREELI